MNQAQEIIKPTEVLDAVSFCLSRTKAFDWEHKKISKNQISIEIEGQKFIVSVKREVAN